MATILELKDRKTQIDRLNKLMEDHSRKIKSMLKEELLAHQLKKLDHAIYWSIVRSRRMTQLMAREILRFHSRYEEDSVKSILKLDAKQNQKIQRAVSKLQDEFHADLAKLYDKYEKRIASELSEKQRIQDKKLFGDTPAFLFKHSNN